ncbi:MAG TPA: DUF4389 domain-containing protein [Acidimicrobiales bacterium]|nr:DUF4389 domain-containing protein [Acidimicrobiales bacterium]
MPTRKAAPKKAAAKSVAAKKAVAKKATAKKATPRKAAAKAAAVEKAPAKKASAKKAPVKKAPVKKAPAKKAAVKRAPAKKAPGRAATPRAAVAPTPTAPPPPPPPPAPIDVGEPTPGEVTVAFEGPGPQRRLTVAFRIILAIPHLLYLFVLSIAAAFAVIGAWFAALFLGRVPEGLAIFLGRVVQYNARFIAYTQLLMTDRYPPFSLDAEDYVVSVSTSPTKLNRAAVFFRLIIAIPANIVTSIVMGGLQVMGVFVWLIVLVTGKLPTPLFEAEAAALRYATRFYAYVSLLTPDYPRGLFGDEAGGGAAEPSEPPPAGRPRITRLVLSQAARRLVILFIVLGVLTGVGSGVAGAIQGGRATALQHDLDESHDRLEGQVKQYSTDAQGCAVSGGLDCVHAANNRLADAFEAFGRRIESLKFPTTSIDAAEQLLSDNQALVATLRKLATVNSLTEYQQGAATFQRQANAFDADYQTLYNEIVL